LGQNVPVPDHPEPDAPPPVDPRDEPAPLGLLLLLIGGSAAVVIAIATFFATSTSVRPLLLGPILLVAFQVVAHEVWWRRWWGALPGAVVGLVTYFEGRAMLADVIGDTWAHPLAYVAAWCLFAVIFALASRFPRTDFSSAR
jgi:hypothetical protein